MKTTWAAVAALSMISAAAIAEDFPPLQRVPVLEEAIPSANPAIKLVRGARVRFAPRQTTGLHRHPISVAGVVTAGSFVFKSEGQPEKIIKTGDAFFEPAGVVSERFDNASSTEPAELIAFYLTDAKDRPLIEMLNTK
ncbi:cupin domain-containing protein [Bradyrhizobium sp.]|uniref:cupin domain-containing protein n=1 Tax=Bradyrhizobium sp. TaxID=376 RepID=UPI002D2A4DB7|nr:cupin domain-containing protein [Bradyrhizobium sp.]HZR73684.1 cupin domain-containing protein [Bradyrhizobium sp.]